jgi:GNAT superfamily N-acetyltransferase
MWVHEDYRRQGLGTKLLSMLEDVVKAIGMEHIYTWTSGFVNPIFYEKQGYHKFTIFEDFFEVKGYHHIGYRKDFINGVTTESNVICRPAKRFDIDRILAQFAAQNDNKPREIWDTYLRELENGERFVILAEADGEIAGYVTLLPRAKDAVPFLEKGIPEIKDFHVFKKFQRCGIGTVLMDRIEAIAAGIADSVCLGVGLHSGYGTAQRMYVKRGYVFDGSGAWNGEIPATPYGMVENGDDLILFMSKKLR